MAKSEIAARKRHEQITEAPRRRPDQASEMEGSAGASRRHEVHQLESGAMLQRDAQSTTPVRKGFHDATARATYATLFRPIAIQAVAAGTRQMSPALKQHGEARRADLPGVLRHGFID